MAADDPRDVLLSLHGQGLHPKLYPMGEDHHTDARFIDDDERLGNDLAHFLGSVFADVEHLGLDYWHRQMTPVDHWRRVARALRVHGLKIADAS